MLNLIFTLIIVGITKVVLANPYWDPTKIPKDPVWPDFFHSHYFDDVPQMSLHGIDLMRIQLDWEEKKDKFSISAIIKESSGTSAWAARVKKTDEFGSYRGYLKDKKGNLLGYESIGTGSLFRKLTRALTFRLPIPSEPAIFELWGENPTSGKMELLLTEEVSGPTAEIKKIDGLEVRRLKAGESPVIVVNLYAEGFKKKYQEKFWETAQKVVETLKSTNFPMFEHFEIYGVFTESEEELGSPSELGFPVPERNSFLGLYYPYWIKFGRWYNVVYPTRESRFREGIGQVPYDYPIAIVDDNNYWGIGNYNEITAIPADSDSFRYLLLHEFGHFFGLNEEYEGGGPTELEFAKGISEPWSQNITFLFNLKSTGIKWKQYVEEATPIPTPTDIWKEKPKTYGAYRGGYADSEPRNHSHKPGFRCMMESGPEFCPVCREAIGDKIKRDLGIIGRY
ncbi:MAG: hypothetical protein A4S09_03205 [Proteobacteria bacterium SG_bin7]|nr:MAG: hypothetical protein A4S09_03205 [Proteobacteria bacterium SG_bin7]